MRETSKQYVVTSVGALALATVFLLVAIGARSMALETTTDISVIKVELR